jgi:iron complex transport system substrate-binding protein
MARTRYISFGHPTRLLVAAFSLALTAACAPAASDNAPPKDGSPDDLPTFVSLNPCLDAILVDIAAPGQIAALSHYSRDPGSSSLSPGLADRFKVTGGTAEEVLALQPDIVLASSFIAPATRAALERVGLRVETFGSPATAEQSAAQVRRMAQLAGRADQGESLVQEMLAPPPRPPADPVSVLLWQPGQIVAGEMTLVAEHLRWAGFVSHSQTMGLDQADYVSLETLLADPPDVLLIAGDQPGQRHPLLDNLKGTLIAGFAPDLLYCGGPVIARARARLMDVRAQFAREIWRAGAQS